MVLSEEFSSKTSIEVKIMGLCKSNNIDKVWANICKHEGEVFYTARNVEYTYVVMDSYILINNDSRRKITKTNLEKALGIQNPTCSKIGRAGIWGPSYIYGIITDSRIK